MHSARCICGKPIRSHFKSWKAFRRAEGNIRRFGRHLIYGTAYPPGGRGAISWRIPRAALAWHAVPSSEGCTQEEFVAKTVAWALRHHLVVYELSALGEDPRIFGNLEIHPPGHAARQKIAEIRRRQNLQLIQERDRRVLREPAHA